jgi:acetyltransferase EpsM
MVWGFKIMATRLVIIGAGALAREAHSLFHNQYDIIGFLDTPYFKGEQINGCPVTNQPLPDTEYIIAVADPNKKKQLALNYPNLPYAKLVHPTAIISDYTYIPKGTIIFPYATVDPNVKFGKHVFIGYHAFIGHHADIGDYSTVFTGTAVSGYTKLREGAYMGAHSCTVNERYREKCVVLGEYCRVGAGAVVTKPVKDGETVIGVPATNKL